MGLLEVQVPARASPAGATLVGPCCTASVESVCPLAAASGAWLDNGSRMSREAHVRFCESGGVRFPSATHRICHCQSEEQARMLRASLEQRFAECGLTLHPEKTHVVYCKDDDRRGDFTNQKFDFLGYTFRPRLARRWQGRIGVSFSPAVSSKALKAVRRELRTWKLPRRSDKSLDDLARRFNPIIRGWINYYGHYYKSALYPTLRHIDAKLAQWAYWKYKSLRGHRRRARHWLDRVARRQSSLFAHWPLLQGHGWTMGAG